MDPDAVRTADRVPHGGSTDPAVLDFSANINPRIPDGVEAVYRDALEASRRYPDDDYPDYREAAGEYVGCQPRAVIPTPGGLAAIRLAIEATVEAGDTVAVPYPSFGEYAREVRLQGADPQFVPHDEITAIDPADHALAVVCTPNNPTGEVVEPDALEAFVERCRERDTPVLVDEAFLGFTDRRSMAGQEGVIVARSLTKLFGLPGLRAGFAVATGESRTALETARRAWNLGTPAAAVGAHCMRQDAFVRTTRERVRSERERLRKGLEKRFTVSPSDAPYLLCELESEAETATDCENTRGETAGDAVDALLEHARDRGIVLRDARTFRGLDGHVRVAVKGREANDRLLEVLGDE
ncbi:aminotransferase class I/II-fold pyridoxal phosphate-dependent enzyme [Halobacteria archaeon AArc-m2/3/4]|uniref:Aminotransferase n=1 Tax=Natronoglomus mannanivorans TaxID=2979990 RepID=A0ABT2QD90_9EURY|nr:aminotransferase class I/II-fold pyridoxal phosphate-dependent enzyme [Halobacteria archaeon AArc-m2/3/4]